MKRERDESGQYVEQVTLDSVMEIFDRTDVPVLTASEIADELGCSRPAAYNKLKTLVEQGKIREKNVGARAVVYWKSPSE